MPVPSIVGLYIALAPALLPWGATEPVSVEPNPVLAGDPVTFRWYFTGDKVTLSGGRFGKGTVVTGRQRLTDTPRKATRYVFDVTYHQTAGPYAGKVARLRHEVVVQVLPPLRASCQPYADPHGWRLLYPKGWQRDSVALPDPGSNGLFYFQKEDDAVERMAVSVMPAQDMSAAALADKVETSLAEHYANINVEARLETTHEGAPARLTTFRAIDLTHPGTATMSVVLAFVRDGRAFVVSARTEAARYKQRQALLEGMVRSIAFGKRTATAKGAR